MVDVRQLTAIRSIRLRCGVDRHVPIAEVVEGALAVHRDAVGTRLRTGGPNVPLAAKPALSLALALHELAINAAKYGPIGQTITIGVRNEGKLVRLWVDDCGPGIAADQRKNAWEPFQRLGGTLDDSTGGAGLGLSIVRDLATAMDATAELSATPTGGTRFTLALHVSHNGAPS